MVIHGAIGFAVIVADGNLKRALRVAASRHRGEIR